MEELFLSDALVDYGGIAKTVNDLYGRFSILQFLDFCSLTEGIVLHDRLIMVGAKQLPKKWEAALKPLIDHNVLIPEPSPSRPMYLGMRPDRGEGFDSRLGFTSEDAWYETGRLIGAEQKHHISTLPFARQKPFYEKSAHTVEDHSVCNLIGQYDGFSEALQRIRESTRLPIHPYLTIPIPPIPLLVLKRSNKPEDLLLNTLEIREEYEKLRNSLRSLREDLGDPQVQVKRKLKLIESWKKSWKTLEVTVQGGDSPSQFRCDSNAMLRQFQHNQSTIAES